MATLSTAAIEKSTYVITFTFADEDGNAVVPNSVVWTLTDQSGTVINSREQVSITPGASVDVVLSGDDLALSKNLMQKRVVVIEADYDSNAGNGLPLNDSATFSIMPLVYVE